MARKDRPAKYIADLLARVKHYTGEPPPVPQKFEGISIPQDGYFSDPVNWEPVRAAFKALKLDARKPEHWETLLYYLADAHFGKPSHKPKTWTEGTLCTLWADFTQMRAIFTGKSQREICQIMVNNYLLSSRYGHLDGDTIRHRLPEARKAFIEHIMAYKKVWIQERGAAAWTPEQEKKVAEQYVEMYGLRLTGVTTLSDLWSE
jgi:hypothetical protein